jgi:hypothetical protein
MNGSIIYYNGYDFSDRGHGHAIYTQNNTGLKLLRDNIMFNAYSAGIHAYTEGGKLDNFRMEGNISFNNGFSSTVSSYFTNILLGGGDVADNCVVTNNYAYHTISAGRGTSADLGYASGAGYLTATDNFFASGQYAAHVNCPTGLTMTGNRFYGSTYGFSQGSYPGNTYYNQTRPTGLFAYVRPNVYEAGRAHICIFNWGNLNSTSVDVSSIPGLQAGDYYELIDAQNPLGPPVATGKYGGSTITVPLNLSVIAPIRGTPSTPPVHTPKEFNAFILQRATSPTPAWTLTVNSTPNAGIGIRDRKSVV